VRASPASRRHAGTRSRSIPPAREGGIEPHELVEPHLDAAEREREPVELGTAEAADARVGEQPVQAWRRQAVGELDGGEVAAAHQRVVALIGPRKSRSKFSGFQLEMVSEVSSSIVSGLMRPASSARPYRNGFSAEPGERRRADAVDGAEDRRVAVIGRADVGQHLHRAMIHEQHGGVPHAVALAFGRQAAICCSTSPCRAGSMVVAMRAASGCSATTRSARCARRTAARRACAGGRRPASARRACRGAHSMRWRGARGRRRSPCGRRPKTDRARPGSWDHGEGQGLRRSQLIDGLPNSTQLAAPAPSTLPPYGARFR
jgi:hypothetical protein